MSTPTEAPQRPAVMPLREFLETQPMGHKAACSAALSASNASFFQLPSIWLYCDHERCGGERYFDPLKGYGGFEMGSGDETKPAFFRYRCRHCNKRHKIYAVAINFHDRGQTTFEAIKLGEDPPAIGRTSRGLQKMLGEEWDLYRRGRQSELSGLGIGAFAYYRRVVEHIWTEILERLLKVARLQSDVVAEQVFVGAQTALSKEGFTHSMEAAKKKVPLGLYIDSHNPLQRLYDACGDGLHEYSDSECLERAALIRLILNKFADRVEDLLGEDKELRKAVGALAARTGQAANPRRD